MQDDLDRIARENLAGVLSGVAADELDPDIDMVSEYGLTSLNKVLFLTAVCDDAGVDIGTFTEQDVAKLRTLRDVTTAFVPHVVKEA